MITGNITAIEVNFLKEVTYMTAKTKEEILKIRDLDISFSTSAGTVHAIRGINLDLMKGETVAIVGESGSGKSVTMKAAMGILATNATVNSGTIEFSYHHEDGTPETVDILKKDKKWIRNHINGKRIAMVFQDPMTSLDPTMPIGKQIMEGMIWHYKTPKDEAWKRSVELLEEVGIEDPEKRMKEYPHQLSGGMRQRVVIAIALACNPDLLICDEPTTALDVTIQAKILELIRKVQTERGISVIYITHDLGVVAKVADYVNVMYAGKIIEKGSIYDIFYDPKHPYTWGLLSAMPDLDTADERLYTIPGSPPNLLHEKAGDAFAPRNRYALKIDDKAEPPMFKISDTHYAATWLLDPRAPKVEMPAELRARLDRIMKEAHITNKDAFLQAVDSKEETPEEALAEARSAGTDAGDKAQAAADSDAVGKAQAAADSDTVGEAQAATDSDAVGKAQAAADSTTEKEG